MLLSFVATGQELPQYVDNSLNKYFPPIIDQAGGSCAQASSIGYVFTYEMNRLLDRDASASPANRFSYRFVWNLVNDGVDQGGFAEDGLFVVMRSGAMVESDFSTLTTSSFTWPSGFEKYRNALRYKVGRIVTIERDVDAYKAYLAGSDGKPGGILSFSGCCYGWNMRYDYDGPSGTGYKAIATSLPDDGAHAMTIVGYDDLVRYTDAAGVVHEGAFIVANSWGESAHDRGRFYYPYDFFRNKYIISGVLSDKAVTAEVKYQEPRILYRLTIQYTSRDDLAYSIGATDKVPSGIPENYYLQTGMSNKGGDHYMCGTYDKGPLEFALDLTDHIPASDPDYCRYFLKITRSARGKTKGEGELQSLSVIDYRGGKPVEYKYKGALPAPLVDGENVFTIGLVPRFSVSCAQERAVPDKPIYLKTASGKKAKVVISKEGHRIKVESSPAK
ncbi:MAG: C1 family peptidase [Bacteroidales bacterium]|nr:C1 family peptidase [Bacteroidales bacterium]